ncbi:MAG: 50S ribosomal protein L21 [Oscillospiraceae bacterium]|jgi:large subunit ribosomal protein L21|nr:50S ribosomal protein L21 [Oscillospiraceae bacterium]
MTAVIITGGKQYKVTEGDVIYVEKLEGASGDAVVFGEVAAVFEGEKVKLGAPLVPGASVAGKIVKTGKRKKIIVYKMHPKKNYRRKQGHRQPYTKVQIEKITVSGKE